MRWLLVLVMISCGSGTPPPIPPAEPPPPPVTVTPASVTVDAAVAAPEPSVPASVCEIDETSFECRCEKGEPLGCVGLAESELRRGQNDIAIARVLPLCQQNVVEACFAAAKFLKQRKLASRHGQSAADLTAKGIAILDERCAASNTDACLQLGRILLAGKVVPKDAKRGLEVVDKACTATNVRACAFLGSMYVAGEGVKKDVTRGAKLLEEACAGGASNGCGALGDVVAKKSKKRAVELYAKACAGDDAEGCAKSGDVKKACELEHADSCVAAGGVETDPVRARAAFQRACDASIPAGCVRLAPFIAEGNGGPRNWGAGVELAERECMAKTAKACAVATKLRATPPAVRCATVETCTPLCDEKIPLACRQLADISLSAADAVCGDAEEGLERACEYGDPDSCVRRGNLALTEQDASPWYERACKAKHAAGCALRDRTSIGDEKRSIASLRRACKAHVPGACTFYAELAFSRAETPSILLAECAAGDARACRVLARIVREDVGDGIVATSGQGATDADAARATKVAELMTRSCQLGDPFACALAKDPDADVSAVQPRCTIDLGWSR